MTDTNSKRILVLLCFIALMLSLSACASKDANTLDSKPKEKIIGSQIGEIHGNYPIYQNVKEHLERSDCVVIASFTDKPRNVSVRNPFEEQLAKERGLEPSDNYVTKYRMNVSEVLAGEVEGDVITLSQLGVYESHENETKLEPNIKYVLFLSRRNYDEEYDETRLDEMNSFFEDDKILYQVNVSETGVFEILEGYLLYSLSDVSYAPSFDGKPLESLISEIKAAAGE